MDDIDCVSVSLEREFEAIGIIKKPKNDKFEYLFILQTTVFGRNHVFGTNLMIEAKNDEDFKEKLKTEIAKIK